CLRRRHEIDLVLEVSGASGGTVRIVGEVHEGLVMELELVAPGVRHAGQGRVPAARIPGPVDARRREAVADGRHRLAGDELVGRRRGWGRGVDRENGADNVSVGGERAVLRGSRVGVRLRYAGFVEYRFERIGRVGEE